MVAGNRDFADTFDPDETDRRYGDGPLERPAFPVFCTVILSIDIFLCLIRLVFVGLGVVGYMALKEQGGGLALTAPFEIAAGAGIVVFGLSGDLFLLLKQKWALGLAGLALLSTVASMGVGIWQLIVLYQPMAGGDAAQQAGYLVGAGFMLLVRLGIVVAYAIALWMFSKWASRW